MVIGFTPEQIRQIQAARAPNVATAQMERLQAAAAPALATGFNPRQRRLFAASDLQHLANVFARQRRPGFAVDPRTGLGFATTSAAQEQLVVRRAMTAARLGAPQRPLLMRVLPVASVALAAFGGFAALGAILASGFSGAAAAQIASAVYSIQSDIRSGRRR